MGLCCYKGHCNCCLPTGSLEYLQPRSCSRNCCDSLPYIIIITIIICAIIAGSCTGTAAVKALSDPQFTAGIAFAVIGSVALIVGIVLFIFIACFECCC